MNRLSIGVLVCSAWACSSPDNAMPAVPRSDGSAGQTAEAGTGEAAPGQGGAGAGLAGESGAMDPPSAPTDESGGETPTAGDEPGAAAEGCDQVLDPLILDDASPLGTPADFESRLTAAGFDKRSPEHTNWLNADRMRRMQLFYLFAEQVDGFEPTYGAGDLTSALDGYDCSTVAIDAALEQGFAGPNNLIAMPAFDAVQARAACEDFKAGVAAGNAYYVNWAPGCGSNCGAPVTVYADTFEWYADGTGSVEVRLLTGQRSCLGAGQCTDVCISKAEIFEISTDWPVPEPTTVACVEVQEECN